MYQPAALAGVLLPYALGRRPPNQAAGIHGAALAHAALAALMSLFGLKSGFAFALWAVAGFAGLICPKEVSAAVCIVKSYVPVCILDVLWQPLSTRVILREPHALICALCSP